MDPTLFKKPSSEYRFTQLSETQDAHRTSLQAQLLHLQTSQSTFDSFETLATLPPQTPPNSIQHSQLQSQSQASYALRPAPQPQIIDYFPPLEPVFDTVSLFDGQPQSDYQHFQSQVEYNPQSQSYQHRSPYTPQPSPHIRYQQPPGTNYVPRAGYQPQPQTQTHFQSLIHGRAQSETQEPQSYFDPTIPSSTTRPLSFVSNPPHPPQCTCPVCQESSSIDSNMDWSQSPISQLIFEPNYLEKWLQIQAQTKPQSVFEESRMVSPRTHPMTHHQLPSHSGSDIIQPQPQYPIGPEPRQRMIPKRSDDELAYIISEANSRWIPSRAQTDPVVSHSVVHNEFPILSSAVGDGTLPPQYAPLPENDMPDRSSLVQGTPQCKEEDRELPSSHLRPKSQTMAPTFPMTRPKYETPSLSSPSPPLPVERDNPVPSRAQKSRKKWTDAEFRQLEEIVAISKKDNNSGEIDWDHVVRCYGDVRGRQGILTVAAKRGLRVSTREAKRREKSMDDAERRR